MSNLLDTCYEKVIDGIRRLDTPEELAQRYLSKHNDIDEVIDDFVTFQKAKCMTSGFLTGLGGIITLPVTIPVNLASVLYV